MLYVVQQLLSKHDQIEEMSRMVEDDATLDALYSVVAFFPQNYVVAAMSAKMRRVVKMKRH